MTGHTSLPPKTTPLPQEANRVSPEERIPSTYEEVDQEAMASPSNLLRPLGTITTRKLLKQLLLKTL